MSFRSKPRMPRHARDWAVGLLLSSLGGLLVLCSFAAKSVEVGRGAAAHRLPLQIEARRIFGPLAPVSRFAAQIQQESGWRPTAESPYAQGLAQFTPDTAKWIAEAYPSDCAPANVWSERWAVRCLVRYDRHLYERAKPMGQGATLAECDRWAFVLSGYNGGAGWTNRDRRAAAGQFLDPNRWADNVAAVSARARWAMLENRGYVRRILGQIEPAFVRAGWPSDGLNCAAVAG